MVRTEVTNGESHVVDDSLGANEGTQDEVGPMLCFAEHVRNAVLVDGFVLVECVVVFVGVRVRCRHQRYDHEGVHLGLGFLQVVTAVVVAALESSCRGGVIRSANILGSFCNRTCTIQGMARTAITEPGFRDTATVDSIELEGCGFHHGIESVAYNECARNIFANFNA